jgi:hypothetical protein
MNFLVVPNRYSTGFLASQTEYRTKQGLMSQNLANDCLTFLESNNNVRSNPRLNKGSAMYPVRNLEVNYGLGTPKDGCECMRYIQPP